MTGSQRFVVSIHDLEQVKLLVFELKQLQRRLAERGQPEADDLLRSLQRFTETRFEDDRV
jgi:hypothetical protein